MPVSPFSRIELNNVSQSFTSTNHQVHLFRQLSLSIVQGQSYAITGPSGSGKSSLLMLMSGLEEPTQGQVSYLQGERVMPVHQLREQTGFIFQQFHLLPELTALSNVALPLKLRGQEEAEQKARAWLEKVGLGHRLGHKPQQMVLTRSLTTPLTHNGNWQRATLKAVGQDYPLQGELRSSAALAGSETTTSGGPAKGEIWLDSRLLTSLSLRIGESLSIADQKLNVTRILQHEPDRLMEGHNVNMRALVNSQDLERFGFAEDIVQHRYLFAASLGASKKPVYKPPLSDGYWVCCLCCLCFC